MVNKIIELNNNQKYVLLEDTFFEDTKYYLGLRLDKNDEPTNNYLFFEEFITDDDVFLLPIDKSNMKGMLLTAFTLDLLHKAYDEAYSD